MSLISNHSWDRVHGLGDSVHIKVLGQVSILTVLHDHDKGALVEEGVEVLDNIFGVERGEDEGFLGDLLDKVVVFY